MIPSVGASAFTGKFPPNSSEPDLIPACGTGLMQSAAATTMPCREDFQNPNIFASARSTTHGWREFRDGRWIGAVCERRHRAPCVECNVHAKRSGDDGRDRNQLAG